MAKIPEGRRNRRRDRAGRDRGAPVAAGPTSDQPGKTGAPAGTMSGRVGDLSPQQQEALARVRVFEGPGPGGLGRAEQPGTAHRAGAPTARRGRGPWRAPLSSRGPVSSGGCAQDTGPESFSGRRWGPVQLSTPAGCWPQSPGSCCLVGGWGGEAECCHPASGQPRTNRSPVQIATSVWLLWLSDSSGPKFPPYCQCFH